MATPFVRCFSRSRTRTSGTREAQDVEEAPARHRNEPRQDAMQRLEPGRMPADEARDDRNGRKDAVAVLELKARSPSQIQILDDWPIAWVLGRIRGPNQAASQQEVHARLQV